jgi:tRNA-dihydrouridine synthase
MQIGNIKLDIPLALAPMAGITDLPYRIICREQGCGLTISEMVSAKGLLYKNIKTFTMLRIADSERPTAIQLFGSSPADLAQAAKIVEDSGAEDMETKEKMEYTVVGTTEADPFEARISNESPVGRAILGEKVGKKVQVSTPIGELSYKILEINKPVSTRKRKAKE